MGRLSVNEPNPHPRPKVDAVAAARSKRRKGIEAKRNERTEMLATVPRAVRAARIQVQLRPSPGTLRECGACGEEIWKWLTTCPKCGASE